MYANNGMSGLVPPMFDWLDKSLDWKNTHKSKSVKTLKSVVGDFYNWTLPQSVIEDTPSQIPYALSTVSKVKILDNTCPKCGSSMVRRIAKFGKHKGNEFLGCSQFPKCKGIRSL